MNSGFVVKPDEREMVSRWGAAIGDTQKSVIDVVLRSQGWGTLGTAKSLLNLPLCLAETEYAWGLGSHADSETVIR